MDPCFIDIKCISESPTGDALADQLKDTFSQKGQIIHSRSSFGFPHTSFTVITFEGKPSTLRINPGLDPLDVDLILEFLNNLAEPKRSRFH